MSTHSTRCPSSAKAAARLSVVVVLATPPFWLANAMTLALPFTAGSYSIGEADRGVIRMWIRDSCMLDLGSPHAQALPAPGEAPEGQARVRLPRRRRRRQDDHLGGARVWLGRAWGEGRRGDDRPGAAPGRRARARRAVGRAPPDHPGDVRRAGTAGRRGAVGNGTRREAHLR